MIDTSGNGKVNGQNMGSAEQNDQDFEMLNLEETEQDQIETQKLIAKKQRRYKIEESNNDLDEVLRRRKRFKPMEDSTSESIAKDSDAQITYKDMLRKAKSNLENGSMREILKMNVQNQLIEQMMEHDSAGHSKLQQKKQELQIIQAGKLTVLNHVSQSRAEVAKAEKSLIFSVIEESPNLFPDLISYWLFQKFHMEVQASNFTSEKTDYSEAVEFIFQCYETNINLTHYSDRLFSKWLQFVLKIPDLKSIAFQNRILSHISAILKQIKSHQIKQFYQILIN
jgi:hypothetical protein